MTQSLSEYLAAVETRYAESVIPDIKPEQLHPSYIAYAEVDGWSLICHYVHEYTLRDRVESIAVCLVPTTLEPTEYHPKRVRHPDYKHGFYEPHQLDAAMEHWRRESERIRQEGIT